MAAIIYNSKAIIPAPFISFRKSYTTTQDGKKIGKVWSITVKGELVSYKGSPNSSKVFHTTSGYPSDENLNADQHFPALLRKQEALRILFATEGALFEVQGYDASAPITFNPRVKGIDIPDGQWFNRCPYSIELETDVLYINGLPVDEDAFTAYISSFDEEWNLEPQDEDNVSFRLNRRLSATGKRFYNSAGTLVKEAWENARDYIINDIGLGLDQSKLVATGVYNNDALEAFNYTRTQSINETAGSFSVVEAWLAIEPFGYPAIEEYTVTVRENEGITTASIDGNIRGLEKRNNSNHALLSTKFANASGKYGEIEGGLFSRVQIAATAVTLNSRALGLSKGQNYKTGVITYTREFNNRPTPTLSGVISELFTVNYDNPGAIVPEIPVIGRAAGPILQDVGAFTSRKKSLSIEAVFPASTQDSFVIEPDTDYAVNLFAPTSVTFVKRIRDQESLTANNGRYSRQVTWVYEV